MLDHPQIGVTGDRSTIARNLARGGSDPSSQPVAYHPCSIRTCNQRCSSCRFDNWLHQWLVVFGVTVLRPCVAFAIGSSFYDVGWPRCAHSSRVVTLSSKALTSSLVAVVLSPSLIISASLSIVIFFCAIAP